MQKKLLFCLLFIIGISFFIAGTAQAATAITGGNDFDSAVAIQAGSYSGGPLVGETGQYFYVTLGQGQLLTVKTAFTTTSAYGTMVKILIYNQDRNQVVEEFDSNYSTASLTAYWLANSNLASSRYYIKLDSDDDDTSAYTMTVTLDNKYDAGSTADAPDTFENAVTLPTGTSAGHLGAGYQVGNDTIDMLKLTPAVSGAYQIRVTPPADARMTMTVYDAQRQEVDQQAANNAGAIVTSTFTADRNSDVYVKFECDLNCSENLVDYSIAVTAPTDTNTNTVVVNANANVNGTVVNGNSNTAVTNSNTNSSANTNTAAVTNTNKTESEEDEGLSTTTILIIAGAGAIVILVIVIILIARKKKTAPPPASPEKK
ncbi:MAG: hypothetical protein PHH01_00720 [Patescibacteria group bacterium]|nr:hypothetical protein [Patescibacteria group bacterium]